MTLPFLFLSLQIIIQTQDKMTDTWDNMTDLCLSSSISYNLFRKKKYLPKEMSVLLIAYYRKDLEKWILSTSSSSTSCSLVHLYRLWLSDSGRQAYGKTRWEWSPQKHLTVKSCLLTSLLIRNTCPTDFWETVIWLCHLKMINKLNCICFSLRCKWAIMEIGLHIHRNANRSSVNHGLTRSVWLTNFLSLCVSLWITGHCKLKILAKSLSPTAWAYDGLFFPPLRSKETKNLLSLKYRRLKF